MLKWVITENITNPTEVIKGICKGIIMLKFAATYEPTIQSSHVTTLFKISG